MPSKIKYYHYYYYYISKVSNDSHNDSLILSLTNSSQSDYWQDNEWQPQWFFDSGNDDRIYQKDDEQ